MQFKPSRPTPEAIARQLRQEAGFGCCRCGHPIIQYHHIVPYATDHHFRPEDMMALCPNCHDEANRGAMALDVQRSYKSQPHNIKKGYAKGFLSINQTNLIVNMGTNIFVGGGVLIIADSEPLVALTLNKSGRIDLTLALRDEQDRPVLSINHNEWVSGDPLPWDIDASYQKLRIRNKKGRVALELNLQKSPIFLNANLWWKGHLIHVSPSTIRVDRNKMDCQFTGCTFLMSSIAFQTTPEPEFRIISNQEVSIDINDF